MNTMELSQQAKALTRAESRVATYESKLAEARRDLKAAQAAHRAAIIDDLLNANASSDAIGARHGVTGGRVRQIRKQVKHDPR